MKRLLTGMLLLWALAPSATLAAHSRPVLYLSALDVSKPPVVRAYVTDLDGTGTPITDRKPQHYRLLVDGLPQTGASRLQRFHEAGEPVAMVLVVQVSPAMRDALTEAVEASKRLVESLPSGSQVGLVAYTDVVVQNLKPTSVASAKDAVDGLRVREDALEVQLPDAIRDALESLDSSALPRQRALVVVSDGLTADLNFSLFSELGRRAQEKAVVVHGIGYAPLEPAHLRTLHELSRRSGGTTREAKDADGVVRGFAALQEAIRNQVVLSYELPASFDGKPHDFQIETPDGQASNILPAELSRVAAPVKEKPWFKSTWFLVTIIVLAQAGLIALVLLALRWRGRAGLQAPGPLGYHDDENDEADDDLEDEEDEEEDTEEQESRGKGQTETRGRRGDARRVGASADHGDEDQDEDQDPEEDGDTEADAEGLEAGGTRDAGDAAGTRTRARLERNRSARSESATPREEAGRRPRAKPDRSVARDAADRSSSRAAAEKEPRRNLEALLAPGTFELSDSGDSPAPAEPSPPAARRRPPAEIVSGVPGKPVASDAEAAPSRESVSRSRAQAAAGSFRLPLPDPDEFLQRGAPRSGGVSEAAASASGLPEFKLPDPEEFLRRAQGSAPSGESPAAASSVSARPAPVLSGSPAASLSRPGPLVAVAPVPEAGVQPGRYIDRRTKVMAVEELDKSDFLAWLAQLDGGAPRTVVVRDGFTLGSSPQCDLQLRGKNALPQHGALRLDAQGVRLEVKGDRGEVLSQVLGDGDQFSVGGSSFVFKLARRTPPATIAAVRLEVLDGMDQGRKIVLQEGEAFTIGCHSSCDLILRGEGVEQCHALAVRKDRLCIISDLGSRQGIGFQGQQVGFKKLRSWEEVMLGTVRLVYVFEEWSPEEGAETCSP